MHVSKNGRSPSHSFSFNRKMVQQPADDWKYPGIPMPDIPAEAITRMASNAKVVPQTVRMGLGKLLAGSFFGVFGGYI